jgi:hypothetical protein
MSLATAEHAGLVKRDPTTGHYVEATDEEKARALAPKGSEEPDGFMSTDAMAEELFPEEIESTIAGLAGDVSGQVLGSVLAQAALRLVDSGDPYRLGDVVSQTGMSPEQAKNFMDFTLAAFSAQAAHELGKVGIRDLETFSAWASANQPAKFKTAVMVHVSARSLNGYRELAREFMKHTAPTEGALQSAGYKTKVDPTTGELLVDLGGGMWESVRTAARAGRI